MDIIYWQKPYRRNEWAARAIKENREKWESEILRGLIRGSVMNKFNWNEFKEGKIAVHCDTEEKAQDFLRQAEKNNIDTGCIEEMKLRAVHVCFEYDKKLEYGNILYYRSMYYKIIKWEMESMEKAEKLTPIEYLMQSLDLKEGEEFYILVDKVNRYADGPFYFTKYGVGNKGNGSMTDYVLHTLLFENRAIQKLPPLTPREAYQKMVELIKESNGDWVPDWTDKEQNKWHFHYNNEENKLKAYITWVLQTQPNELYFRYEAHENLINKITHLYKIWLGVETQCNQ